MPTSDPNVIPVVIGKVMEFKPKSILDVGVGFGKYGILCREYLEIWQNHVYKPAEWKTKIIGIEAFYGYANFIHKIAYDGMIYGNVMDHLEELGKYDLVIIADVMEHLFPEEGEALLKAIKNHYIVTTPKVTTGQGAEFDNPYEVHKSNWDNFPWPNRTEVGGQIVAWR